MEIALSISNSSDKGKTYVLLLMPAVFPNEYKITLRKPKKIIIDDAWPTVLRRPSII